MNNLIKNLKTGICLVIILALSSCANVSKFPVSSVSPAANIEMRTQQDNNGNTKLTITAKNLAAAERLTPPKKMYVAWIILESNKVRNIGQLNSDNAKKAEIKTLVPFKFTEVFITAEDRADISYPKGVEISRIKF
ncbi:MAG: hypothetical protein JZU53_05405 [Paludibacter sp.]|nr:hypothetical protein [Paludibacter sp.]